MAGLIALFAWSPWKDATEVEWLGTYRAWSDVIDASLHAGLVISRPDCEATFADAGRGAPGGGRGGRRAAGAAAAGGRGRAGRLRGIESGRVAERQGRRRACAD